MVGALAGIVAGAAAETVLERRRPPEPAEPAEREEQA
jgi:hypothetical protein